MKSIQVTNFQKSFVWLVILLLAMLSRFFELTNKPLHFDESINGWFVMQMKTLGYYKYDPNNYHGPLYFYLLQFFEFLWGRSVQTLRSLPSVFSVLSVMIFSFPMIRSKCIRYGMMFFLLLSPAFLFYGRSGIHEMPFVFFQLVFALGLLRWLESRDAKALAFLLIGLVGMMTLKETFVLTLASWCVGILFLGWQEIKRCFSFQNFKQAWSGRLTYLTALLLFVFVALFTGFFHNRKGLVDFIRAFLPWMKTGVGETGHNKEFWYWCKVLWEAEPLVILGVILAMAGLLMRDSRLRMVSAFSLAQLLVYSLIPYKTVWCILSLVWGFYFVLAMFAEKIWKEQLWKRILFSLALICGVVWGAWSSWLSVYRVPISMDHPYVYVNSTYDLKNLVNVFETVFSKQPSLRKEPFQVGLKEQWPWPWFLRNLEDTHWDLCGRAVVAKALVYMCDPEDAMAVEEHLQGAYLKIHISFRQSRETSLVYLRKNVFDGVYLGQYEVVGPGQEK
ncbi:MAG: flippase activity-associated protein Agl23 [Bacillota bacterium]